VVGSQRTHPGTRCGVAASSESVRERTETFSNQLTATDVRQISGLGSRSIFVSTTARADGAGRYNWQFAARAEVIDDGVPLADQPGNLNHAHGSRFHVRAQPRVWARGRASVNFCCARGLSWAAGQHLDGSRQAARTLGLAMTWRHDRAQAPLGPRAGKGPSCPEGADEKRASDSASEDRTTLRKRLVHTSDGRRRCVITTSGKAHEEVPLCAVMVLLASPSVHLFFCAL
jgi:hypothetical protein